MDWFNTRLVMIELWFYGVSGRLCFTGQSIESMKKNSSIFLRTESGSQDDGLAKIRQQISDVWPACLCWSLIQSCWESMKPHWNMMLASEITDCETQAIHLSREFNAPGIFRQWFIEIPRDCVEDIHSMAVSSLREWFRTSEVPEMWLNQALGRRNDCRFTWNQWISLVCVIPKLQMEIEFANLGQCRDAENREIVTEIQMTQHEGISRSRWIDSAAEKKHFWSFHEFLSRWPLPYPMMTWEMWCSVYFSGCSANSIRLTNAETAAESTSSSIGWGREP
jgi:hypothetical protein